MSAVALFNVLTPAEGKKARVTSLLQSTRPYFQSTPAQCTTWTYFAPSTRSKAPTPFGPDVLASLEIYTSLQALEVQKTAPALSSFESSVASEALYSKPEALTLWNPQYTAGFMARGDSAPPIAAPGALVMSVVMTAKEGGRDSIVAAFADFSKFVRDNEPDVLTYICMTSPERSDEMFIFERYNDLKALGQHGGSPQFKTFSRTIKPFLKGTVMAEWTELAFGFVGNVVGGDKLKEGLEASPKL